MDAAQDQNGDVPYAPWDVKNSRYGRCDRDDVIVWQGRLRCDARPAESSSRTTLRSRSESFNLERPPPCLVLWSLSCTSVCFDQCLASALCAQLRLNGCFYELSGLFLSLRSKPADSNCAGMSALANDFFIIL